MHGYRDDCNVSSKTQRYHITTAQEVDTINAALRNLWKRAHGNVHLNLSTILAVY